MNGLPVRMTDKKTGYHLEGIYKAKTSDCHIVQMNNGTDTLFKIDDWNCDTLPETEPSPLAGIKDAFMNLFTTNR